MLCLCLCVCLPLGLTACGEPTSEEMARIYDDAEKLANPYNNYKMEGMEQKIDGNRMSGKFDKMEGMIRFWEMDADKEMAVNITYRLKVNAGKAKLVFIYPDDTIETIVECNGPSGDYDYVSVGLSLKKGLNRIKLVGGMGTTLEYEVMVSDGSLLPL